MTSAQRGDDVEIGPALNVFVSYQKADASARDDLIHALSRVDLSFLFCPLRDDDEESWRDAARNLIHESSGTLVLIGRTTHLSDPVAWEIAETRRVGNPVLGIELDSAAGREDLLLIDVDMRIAWDPIEIESRLREWKKP